MQMIILIIIFHLNFWTISYDQYEHDVLLIIAYYYRNPLDVRLFSLYPRETVF